VETIVVHPGPGERWNPGHAVSRFVSAAQVSEDVPVRETRPWLGAWVRRDRELAEALSTRHEPDLAAARETGYKERSSYARAEVRAMREAITREMLCETLWQATWPHDRLVLGASRLIRVLDRVAPSRKLTVHSNRGLAGIDGTVATALGVALASQDGDEPRHAAGVTRVLLGDVTLLHDLGSLVLGAGEERPRIQLIVGNDGGGTIFDDLEVARSAEPAAFDRVMLTPHAADLGAFAEAAGWHFQRVSTRVELERAFTAPVAGPSIIEVPLPRGE
ncbi:thiamine pyrophosphate-dependent enzyme, partial [Leucobacter sp. M11]|nr:thiamine pyrophosphate-dependent enzyme [Leucobacter sp. M11]